MLDKISRWFDDMFNEQKLIRRLLVLWAVWLITWVTLRVFDDVTVITAAAATALATITALLTIVIAFYQWTRKQEDQ